MATADPFSPLRVGPLALRNRFIKAATNEGMARGGTPSRALVEHHRRIAAGGAAMTTVAYCAVSPDGRTFEDQVTLDDASLPHLRALTDAVHGEGAAVSAQLTHGGAFTFLPQLSTRYPRSASGGFNPPGVLCGRLFKTAMSEADLDATAELFVAAARRARDAGFDAVELHMGHGYLLSQFLSPLYNRRRDGWGGDAAARVRFPALVLRRVLTAVGRDLAVLCKLSVTEGHDKGAPIDDVCVTARALQAEGAHMLVLSGGMNVEAPWAIFGSNMPDAAVTSLQGPMMRAATRLMKLREPKITFRELYLRDYSRRVRDAVSLPLAYLGGAKSRQGIDTVMADGFDAVVMGRALLYDPAFVRQLERGEIAHSGCTACNDCVASMYTEAGTHCVLTQTPDPALNRVPAAPVATIGHPA